jgi:hypothetical protein
MAGEVFLHRAAAEFPEDEAADGEVEEGAGEEAEEDHDGDGVEDFAAGLAGPAGRWFSWWLCNTKHRLRPPDSLGNRMSPRSSESAAFEISTAAREATPTAVETRSEFRYRIEAAAPRQIRSASPFPRSGILKKFRPQAVRPRQPPSKLVPSSATKSARGLRGI